MAKTNGQFRKHFSTLQAGQAVIVRENDKGFSTYGEPKDLSSSREFEDLLSLFAGAGIHEDSKRLFVLLRIWKPGERRKIFHAIPFEEIGGWRNLKLKITEVLRM